MKTLIKLLLISTFLNGLAFGEDCVPDGGRYGNNMGWSNRICRFILVSTRSNVPPDKNLIFNDEGLVQIFSDFSTSPEQKTNVGYRVYYIFPLQTKKSIDSKGPNGLSLTHTSGARFNFDKNGIITSPDLKMKYDPKINPDNKGGLEIESYSKGLVFDLGYKRSLSPKDSAATMITVTDKNLKKCIISNSDFHIVTKNDATPRFKTNESLHAFLSKKCPNLDISDLLKPLKKDFESVARPSKIGVSPKKDDDAMVNETSRKTTIKDMDALDAVINKLQNNDSPR